MTAGANNGFAALARRYDAWYAKPVGAWADRLETEAEFRLLSLRPGERLLDLGAGTGRYAVEAARRGAAVVALDSSAEMLAIARQQVAGTAVTLVRADATHLPFAAATFDAVLAVTSLCFAADPAAVLTEIERVLRPGGRLILGELNRLSLWALLRRAEDRIHPTAYRDAHFRDIGELRQLLQDHGFTVERWEGILHLPPVNNATWLQSLDPLERAGQRWSPRFGAFLAIEARKA